MIRVVRTLVDKNCGLIGLEFQGKDSEFGGKTNEIMYMRLQLSVLKQRGFRNKQIAINSKEIKELGDFKLNSLPMQLYNGTALVDIDNSVILTKRFTVNGEIVGFKVANPSIGTMRFRYNDVIRLSLWFKPVNYIIKTSVNGKLFIAGKAGELRLEELPEVDITKKKKEHSKEPLSRYNALDAISFFNTLKIAGGLVIMLPDEAYEKAASSKTEMKVESSFTSMNIGEYASAHYEFTETKLNMSMNFKKPGMVAVELVQGVSTNIESFVLSKKNIYTNMKCRVERLGIAVPEDKATAIVDRFGKALNMQLIQDNLMLQYVASLGFKTRVKIYSIQLANLPIVAPDNYINTIKHCNEINLLVAEKYAQKLIHKYLGEKSGLIGKLKRQLKTGAGPQSDDKCMHIFESMNEEQKTKLSKAGIDLRTGAYKKVLRTRKSPLDIEFNEDIDKGVKIDFFIQGKEVNKINIQNIIDWSRNGDKIIPDKVRSVVLHFEDSKESVEEKLKEAYGIYNKADEILDQINKTLWEHKCALLLKGNGGIPSDILKNWKIDDGTRRKAVLYRCIQKGCTGLCMTVENLAV